MMILNPIKIKENYKNNNLNFTTLNENINQNQFLTKIKQLKNSGSSNPNPSSNQYYSNNINNVNNNRNIESNNINGPQIFNNFYSINNIGNCKIPVKVINVFN